MSRFDLAFQLLLKHEGTTFVDDVLDSGGATRFGISLRFYKLLKPDAVIEDIKNMTLAQAEQIYQQKFWIPNRYQELDSQHLASRMLDLCANMGAHSANTCLQQALNLCSPKIVDTDGIVGIRTLAAANSQTQDKLYQFLIDMATLHYQDIAKIAHSEVWLSSWLDRLKDTP